MTDRVVDHPERVFRMGAMELSDPAPDEPASKALAYYAEVYPVIASSALAAPVLEGARYVYEIIKPHAETKG